jgi:formylglycine-generating enzyme required for sulfatase activity
MDWAARGFESLVTGKDLSAEWIAGYRQFADDWAAYDRIIAESQPDACGDPSVASTPVCTGQWTAVADGEGIEVPDGGVSEPDMGVSPPDMGQTQPPVNVDIEWIRIEGGRFMMGSDSMHGYNDERPAHQVTVPTFEISRSEVTVAQYRACFNGGACDEPPKSGLRDNVYNWTASPGNLENHPINGVTWDNAQQFCEWIGARLPSEAEWEYAARSQGRNITYPWGDAEADCQRANYGGCAGDDGANTFRVCTHASGNSAQGVCDLAGNVEELLEDDYHDSYQGAPNDGSAWVDNPAGRYKVTRGGTWASRYRPDAFLSSFIRAGRRRQTPRPALSPMRGFRLARNANNGQQGLE